MFCAIATGAVTSWTVTVAFAVLVFPFTSVTVNTTGLTPTLEQLNEVGVEV